MNAILSALSDSLRFTVYYGDYDNHLEVTEAILGGYGGDDFREFFEGTSGAIDSMSDDFEVHFPEMRKKFNIDRAVDANAKAAAARAKQASAGANRADRERRFCE